MALTELVRAEGQLAELRLRVLADAGDLAVATAARDAAGWLAQADPDPVRRRPRRPGAGDRAGPRPPGAGRGDARRGRDVGAGTGDPPRGRRPPLERRRGRCSEGRGAPGRPGGGVRSARSSPGSGAGSSRSWHPGSPRRPRHDAWPSSRPMPRTRPGSRCAASATAPPGSPRAFRTPPRPGWRPTSRPSPTPPSRCRRAAGQQGTRSRACPTPSGWVRRSPVLRVGRPRAAPGPRRRRHHGRRLRPARVPQGTELGTADLLGSGLVPGDEAPVTSSPPPRPDASPAPRRSFPPSSAATTSRSISAAPADCSHRVSARHS